MKSTFIASQLKTHHGLILYILTHALGRQKDALAILQLDCDLLFQEEG